MANHWPRGGQAKTSVVNDTMTEFVKKQEQANRIEGQFDALRDRVNSAGNNEFSDDEMSEMRAEMTVLSSQYFDLTGLTLE
ncbi:hypothetical protein ACUVZD_000098 [Pseudomonas aeruginosa]